MISPLWLIISHCADQVCIKVSMSHCIWIIKKVWSQYYRQTEGGMDRQSDASRSKNSLCLIGNKKIHQSKIFIYFCIFPSVSLNSVPAYRSFSMANIQGKSEHYPERMIAEEKKNVSYICKNSFLLWLWYKQYLIKIEKKVN